MGTLLAIDPGKHQCAWALFEKCELSRCDLHTPGQFALNVFPCLDEVIIEIPKVYPPRSRDGGPMRSRRVDPNDLIDVTFTAGVVTGIVYEKTKGPTITNVRPYEWKGQRPKKVDNAFTFKLLYDRERQLIEQSKVPKSKRHNLLDAIGIGLWRLDRR